MNAIRWGLVALGLVGLLGSAGHGRTDPCSPTPAKQATLDPAELAARIDQLIAAPWAEKHVQPAPLADDSEFLRRIYLDLAGRIPRTSEVRDFLEDPAPDKRSRLIDRLLDDPDYVNLYVNHFTNVWRTLLLPQADNDQVRPLVPGFEAWLRKRLRDNRPYDELVRELLTAPPALPMARRNDMRNLNAVTPTAFYQANELKPENLAGTTSRLFLGIKIECAQCHDHPHANWKRKQFWEYAAFFSGVQPARAGQGGGADLTKDLADGRAIKIPGRDEIALAHFLDGTEPRWEPGLMPRTALAGWVTARRNPFFARTAVNRLWAWFFGLGIIEPVDDLGEQNPPSHPELLEELARQFADHHFDLKYLIRAITRSQTYQRSSLATHPSQEEPRLFARMAVRGLSAEQLFDSVALATGTPNQDATAIGPDGLPFNSRRAQFLARFGNHDHPTEAHTTILQALSLMNGSWTIESTNVPNSQTLAAVVDAPFLTTEQRLETLFLAAYARKPRADELSRLTKYVDSGGPKSDGAAALADVFWALLNSAEFMLNH